MIHQYQLGGYNIVLDICSGSVHVVDEVAYDIISMFEETDKNEILASLNKKYGISFLGMICRFLISFLFSFE